MIWNGKIKTPGFRDVKIFSIEKGTFAPFDEILR